MSDNGKLKNIYALLVGINDYGGRGNLTGCLNDINLVEKTLKKLFSKRKGYDLQIKKLQDCRATYDNVIDGFSKHLAQAKADDFAYFHYSGHGSRQPSAEHFRKEYPNGLDETLVLYDSRRDDAPNSYDLADKELAVLANKVTEKGAHFTAVMDCCHSGSIFRDGYEEEEGQGEKGVRQNEARKDGRALATYLDGYYTKEGQGEIPSSDFISLTACANNQVAREDQGAWPGFSKVHGVFTLHFAKALESGGFEKDYVRLFQQVRFSVASAGFRQDPQFEPHGRFNTGNTFLSDKTAEQGKMFEMRFDREREKWVIPAGLFAGFATDMSVRLFDPLVERKVFKGRIAYVNQNESIVEITDRGVKKGTTYLVQFGESPKIQLSVYLKGAENKRDSIRRWFDEKNVQIVHFPEQSKGCRFMINIQGREYTLYDIERRKVLVTHTMSSEKLYERLLETFEHLYRWQTIRRLNYDDARLSTKDVEVFFETKDENDSWQMLNAKSSVVNLDFVREGHNWRYVPYRVRIKNNTNTPLHVRPFVLEGNLFNSIAIDVFELPAEAEMELFDDYLGIENEEDASITDYLKLVIATKDVDIDASQLALPSIEPLLEPLEPVTRGGEKGLTMRRKAEESKQLRGVWCTRTLTINTTRRDNRLRGDKVELADGRVKVSHDRMKADVSLQTPRKETYRNDRSPLAAIPIGDGVEIFSLTGSRDLGDTLLELHAIEGMETVTKENPLLVELGEAVGENERFLPIATDGEAWMFLPHTTRAADNATQIAIEEIPDIDDDFGKRSVFKALKMAFIRVVFPKKEINSLKKVRFEIGEKPERSDLSSTDVKTAKRIFFCMHGIIGDSMPVAEGVRNAITQNGGDPYDSKENLILTYDYENLKTSIATTADQLSERLEKYGLDENDIAKMTIVVHSMGGLVTRALLQRNSKWHQRIDKIVFCGTPNDGSRFGKVDEYRRMLAMLISFTLRIGVGPLGWLADQLNVLDHMGEITVTLGEMNSGSDLLKRLADSDDPGIPYHIIAGDLSAYLRATPGHRIKLLERLAIEIGETLYGNRPNDIAVAVDSIHQIQSWTAAGSTKETAPCHHLNYFEVEAALDSLANALKN